MTDLGLGVLIGSVGMFIAMIAVGLYITRGPHEKVWEHLEHDE